MSNTIANLRRKIEGAKDLRSVVRTMKAMAAANIGQYENSVRALLEYTRTAELGLSLFFRKSRPTSLIANGIIHAVVFGSDQGLVGQFNDVIADFAITNLTKLSLKSKVWVVGERVHARLENSKLSLMELFTVPSSVKAITPLIEQILIKTETPHSPNNLNELHLFYNSPTSGPVYSPIHQKLLPLDQNWLLHISQIPWPTKNLPEVMGGDIKVFRTFIREYLFISLFRACAESLASENASRLAAMQRANKNIEELLEVFHGNYYRLRQSGIDEELFDVISGFEAFKSEKRKVDL